MKSLIFVLIFIIASGCGSVQLQTQSPPADKEFYTETYDSWLFSFAGEGQAVVEGVCPNGIARIRNYFSTEDILLGVITFGIYTPFSSRITCAQSEAQQ